MPRSINELKKEIASLRKKKRDLEERKKLEQQLKQLRASGKKIKPSLLQKISEGPARIRRKHPRITSILDNLASSEF